MLVWDSIFQFLNGTLNTLDDVKRKFTSDNTDVSSKNALVCDHLLGPWLSRMLGTGEVLDSVYVLPVEVGRLQISQYSIRDTLIRVDDNLSFALDNPGRILQFNYKSSDGVSAYGGTFVTASFALVAPVRGSQELRLAPLDLYLHYRQNEQYALQLPLLPPPGVAVPFPPLFATAPFVSECISAGRSLVGATAASVTCANLLTHQSSSLSTSYRGKIKELIRNKSGALFARSVYIHDVDVYASSFVRAVISCTPSTRVGDLEQTFRDHKTLCCGMFERDLPACFIFAGKSLPVWKYLYDNLYSKYSISHLLQFEASVRSALTSDAEKDVVEDANSFTSIRSTPLSFAQAKERYTKLRDNFASLFTDPKKMLYLKNARREDLVAKLSTKKYAAVAQFLIGASDEVCLWGTSTFTNDHYKYTSWWSSENHGRELELSGGQTRANTLQKGIVPVALTLIEILFACSFVVDSEAIQQQKLSKRAKELLDASDYISLYADASGSNVTFGEGIVHAVYSYILNSDRDEDDLNPHQCHVITEMLERKKRNKAAAAPAQPVVYASTEQSPLPIANGEPDLITQLCNRLYTTEKGYPSNQNQLKQSLLQRECARYLCSVPTLLNSENITNDDSPYSSLSWHVNRLMCQRFTLIPIGLHNVTNVLICRDHFNVLRLYAFSRSDCGETVVTDTQLYEQFQHSYNFGNYVFAAATDNDSQHLKFPAAGDYIEGSLLTTYFANASEAAPTLSFSSPNYTFHESRVKVPDDGGQDPAGIKNAEKKRKVVAAYSHLANMQTYFETERKLFKEYILARHSAPRNAPNFDGYFNATDQFLHQVCLPRLHESVGGDRLALLSTLGGSSTLSTPRRELYLAWLREDGEKPREDEADRTRRLYKQAFTDSLSPNDRIAFFQTQTHHTPSVEVLVSGYRDIGKTGSLLDPANAENIFHWVYTYAYAILFQNRPVEMACLTPARSRKLAQGISTVASCGRDNPNHKLLALIRLVCTESEFLVPVYLPSQFFTGTADGFVKRHLIASTFDKTYCFVYSAKRLYETEFSQQLKTDANGYFFVHRGTAESVVDALLQSASQ